MGKNSRFIKCKEILIVFFLIKFIQRSQVSAAYELCLNEGDEETLLNLMIDTGRIFSL